MYRITVTNESGETDTIIVDISRVKGQSLTDSELRAELREFASRITAEPAANAKVCRFARGCWEEL